METIPSLFRRAAPGGAPNTPAEVERLSAEVRSLRAELEALKRDLGGVRAAPACQLVTLSQAAAMVCRSKDTLRKYRRLMPAPREAGGNGFATRWAWHEIRPWLEERFGVSLERWDYFPGTPQGQSG